MKTSELVKFKSTAPAGIMCLLYIMVSIRGEVIYRYHKRIETDKGKKE